MFDATFGGFFNPPWNHSWGKIPMNLHLLHREVERPIYLMIHQSIHFLDGQHLKCGGEICHVFFAPGLTYPKGFKKDWLPVFELCCNMFFLGALVVFLPLIQHGSIFRPFHSNGPLRPCVILVLVFGRQG